MSFVIPRRFCGPPESGNGGWVSGRLASHVAAGTSAQPAVTVRLASPPPLDRELQVIVDDGTTRLLDGDTLVASATPAGPLGDDVPAPVTYAEAVAAAPAYEGFVHHPFPTCFSCGTERECNDALCLSPAPMPGRDGLYAAAWVPQEVSAELVWAALDCPGGWVAGVAEHPMVLGTLTTQILALPEVGAEHVVSAWRRGSQGRKHHSSSALFDAAGNLLAHAQATWIAVDPTSIRPASAVKTEA